MCACVRVCVRCVWGEGGGADLYNVVVGLQKLQRSALFKDGTQRPILSVETQAH